jgi:hypothetical protein
MFGVATVGERNFQPCVFPAQGCDKQWPLELSGSVATVSFAGLTRFRQIDGIDADPFAIGWWSCVEPSRPAQSVFVLKLRLRRTIDEWL